MENDLRIEHWSAGVAKCEDPLTITLSPKMVERAGVRAFRRKPVQNKFAQHTSLDVLEVPSRE